MNNALSSKSLKVKTKKRQKIKVPEVVELDTDSGQKP